MVQRSSRDIIKRYALNLELNSKNNDGNTGFQSIRIIFSKYKKVWQIPGSKLAQVFFYIIAHFLKLTQQKDCARIWILQISKNFGSDFHQISFNGSKCFKLSVSRVMDFLTCGYKTSLILSKKVNGLRGMDKCEYQNRPCCQRTFILLFNSMVELHIPIWTFV